MRNYNQVNVQLTAIDKTIINRYQTGIPLNPTPYKTMAESLGIAESLLLERLQHLLDSGVLTRFGPLYDAEKMGGFFTLCAMQVPAEKLDDTATIINNFDEVAHHYERDHRLNLWFVLALESKDQLNNIIHKIEHATTYPILNFPKQREFHVGLTLEV